jgi:hypothetical protein
MHVRDSKGIQREEQDLVHASRAPLYRATALQPDSGMRQAAARDKLRQARQNWIADFS